MVWRMDGGGLSGLPVLWAPDCLRHDPQSEIWVGVEWPATEVAERIERVVATLTADGADVREAAEPDLAAADALLAEVHDPGLIRHLREVHGEWERAGMPQRAGQPRVVPYVFPTPGMLGGMPLSEPAAVHGRAGRWCYDTMTLVGAGTWPAARAAAGAAAAAARRVAAGPMLVFAAVRPPGHHVTREAYGGSCYLNNAAVAVAALHAAGAARVAVLDLDAHHGNGT